MGMKAHCLITTVIRLATPLERLFGQLGHGRLAARNSWMCPSVLGSVSFWASSGETSNVMTGTFCASPAELRSSFCPAAMTYTFSITVLVWRSLAPIGAPVITTSTLVPGTISARPLTGTETARIPGGIEIREVCIPEQLRRQPNVMATVELSQNRVALITARARMGEDMYLKRASGGSCCQSQFDRSVPGELIVFRKIPATLITHRF